MRETLLTHLPDKLIHTSPIDLLCNRQFVQFVTVHNVPKLKFVNTEKVKLGPLVYGKVCLISKTKLRNLLIIYMACK